MLTEEFYITKSSLEVFLDIFYYSFAAVFAFGFATVYFAKETAGNGAYYLFLGLLLWEIIRVAQYTLSVGALWEVWSKNLTNIFISPISVTEYMAAQMFSGAIKAFLVFLMISLISIPLFSFNIFKIGLFNLALFYINLVMFAWFTGIVILGLIFRFGTKIQALAWGLIFLFQPLTAAFFPLSVLPSFMQHMAYAFPPTYVFEAARQSLSNPSINAEAFFKAFGLNIMYLIVGIMFFNYMFKKSKETGQFVKNEG